MASPLSADRLVKALTDEGVTIVEYRDWRDHNRNHVGAWGPVHGVMIHHTVTSGTDTSLELCYEGDADLPGPRCHGVIDKDGTVYLVGNGRANHAGSGDGDVLDAVIDERALPPDSETDTDGNTHFYGFECVNLGDNEDPWPEVQVEAIVRASAALCRAHGWGKAGNTSVIGHYEWNPEKVDPRGPGITMGDVRTRVANRLKHSANWNPEEDDMPERALYETSSDLTRTVEPSTWTTLRFDRRYTDGEWKDKDAEPSFLFGSCYYTASVGVRVTGLKKGQEFQLRLANYRDTGEEEGFTRSAAMPAHSPVHEEGEGRFVYTWTGFISSSDKGRVRAEVWHGGDEPVTVEWARAEALYWSA